MSLCTYSMLNVFASAMLILYSLQSSNSSERAHTHVLHVVCVLLAHRCETGNILMMRLFASFSIRWVWRRFCFQPIYVSKTKQKCILLKYKTKIGAQMHMLFPLAISHSICRCCTVCRAHTFGLGHWVNSTLQNYINSEFILFFSVLLSSEFPCGNKKRRRCIHSLVTRNTGNLENHFKNPKCRRLAFFGVCRRRSDIWFSSTNNAANNNSYLFKLQNKATKMSDIQNASSQTKCCCCNKTAAKYPDSWPILSFLWRTNKNLYRQKKNDKNLLFTFRFCACSPSASAATARLCHSQPQRNKQIKEERQKKYDSLCAHFFAESMKKIIYCFDHVQQ